MRDGRGDFPRRMVLRQWRRFLRGRRDGRKDLWEVDVVTRSHPSPDQAIQEVCIEVCLSRGRGHGVRSEEKSAKGKKSRETQLESLGTVTSET